MTKLTRPMFGLVLAMVPLGGCVEPSPLPVPPGSDSCGAETFQTLVGQRASVLHTVRFGTETRFLRPGIAATADYVETRLNVTIDKDEMIVAVSCG